MGYTSWQRNVLCHDPKKDKYDLALWTYTNQLEEFFETENVSFSSFLYHTIEVVWKDQNLLRSIIEYTGQNNFRQSVFSSCIPEILKKYLQKAEK